MLSFFRSKSTETQVSDITIATQNLKMQSSLASSTDTSGIERDSSTLLISLGYKDATELKETIYGKPNSGEQMLYDCGVLLLINANGNAMTMARIISDILRTIRDPEKPNTLEDLNVVYEEGVFIQEPTSDNVQVVS